MFTGLARSGNDIALSFVTEVGQNYRLESTDILAPAAWTIVADILPGNGSSMQVIDTGGATHPQRFYRARMLP